MFYNNNTFSACPKIFAPKLIILHISTSQRTRNTTSLRGVESGWWRWGVSWFCHELNSLWKLHSNFSPRRLLNRLNIQNIIPLHTQSHLFEFLSTWKMSSTSNRRRLQQNQRVELNVEKKRFFTPHSQCMQPFFLLFFSLRFSLSTTDVKKCVNIAICEI